MISAYCGDCDKQIELTNRTVLKGYTLNGELCVRIVCTHCDDVEEVLLDKKK
jgi:hypothetical protein